MCQNSNNSVGLGWSSDGIFTTGCQIELTKRVALPSFNRRSARPSSDAGTGRSAD